jgi:replicative DNA helicase
MDIQKLYLGCLLLNNNLLYDSILKPDDFSPVNKLIFAKMQELNHNNKPFDMPILFLELKNQIPVTELSKLSEVSSIYNAKEYEYKIKEESNINKLVQIGDIAKDKSKSYDEKIEESYNLIINLETTKDKPLHISEVNKDIAKDIANIKVNGLPELYSSGFYDLDSILDIKRSDLIIFAARPAMGKTAFMLDVAKNFKKIGLVISLEMANKQLAYRFISGETGFSTREMRRGNFFNDGEAKFNLAINKINQYPIYLYDKSGIDIIELCNIARKCKIENKIDFIMVDYLQLVTAKKQNREQEISYIARSLKNLAKELDVPVVALSQLSRALESRSDKRPMLSDLRESGAIEQDADSVVFLYRPEYYGVESDSNGDSIKGVCEVIVAKQRAGALGTAKLGFKAESTTFYNICSFSVENVI